MRPVNRRIKRLYREQVYEKLKNLIIFKGWEQGTVLSEVQLAKSFGISRTPVREALRHLQSEGLVNVQYARLRQENREKPKELGVETKGKQDFSTRTKTGDVLLRR